MATADEHESCGIRQLESRSLRVSPAFAERQPLEQGDHLGDYHSPTVVQHPLGVARVCDIGRCGRALPVLQCPRKVPFAPADAHKQGANRVSPEFLHQHYARVPHAFGHNTGRCGQADGRKRGTVARCLADCWAWHSPFAAPREPADGVSQGDNRQHEDTCRAG